MPTTTNASDDNAYAPWHSPYHFYFRFMVFVPTVIRLLLLTPIVKDILTENRVSPLWLLRLIRAMPSLLQQIIQIIPQVLIPLIITFIISRTIGLILFFLDTSTPFAWTSWSDTPSSAAIIFITIVALFAMADYIRITLLAAKLAQLRDSLRKMSEKDKEDAKKCAERLIANTTKEQQEQDKQQVSVEFTSDPQGRKGTWQVLKVRLADILFEAASGTANFDAYRQYFLVMVEGVAAQLFMVFLLRLLYYTYAYTLIFVPLFAAGVYYSYQYVQKRDDWKLLDQLEVPVMEGIMIDVRTWLVTSGVQAFIQQNINNINNNKDQTKKKTQ